MLQYSPPTWHRESFERLLQDRLPELLAARLPLAGYERRDTPAGAALRVTITGPTGDVAVEFTALPQPDAEGIFTVDGKHLVVVPLASDEHLATATIRCVGEQLYDRLAEQIGEAPPDLPWDAALLRSWLALDRRFQTFIATTAVPLDEQNWLAREACLRRVVLPAEAARDILPEHFGRTCPFETPEGPNIGRILALATGAVIRHRRLEVVDDRMEARLGLTAQMIPFLEHDDANRVLMGVNMLRQCQVPEVTEPALVQTGCEPDGPGFWAGYNLLTAFTSWGVDTFEDGLVLSASAVRRCRYAQPLEPGDKLCNRHGTKGVIARILPDDEMPHLADGTPVELVFNFIGCHTRLNFGQIREAVAGRLAKAEGQPFLAPPLAAPKAAELRRRLQAAGLPATGMETLRQGRGGPPLARPTTVGYVYWGRTSHDVRYKLQAAATPGPGGNLQGLSEYQALRDAGASETIIETFNTRSALRPEAATLVEQVIAGEVAQAPAPTPAFAELTRRLAMAGVQAVLAHGEVAFHLAPPPEPSLVLAQPITHPWLSKGPELSAVGIIPGAPALAPLAEANDRLGKLLAARVPPGLVAAAVAQVRERARTYLDELVQPDHLHFSAQLPHPVAPLGHRVGFSGRSVLAPASNLAIEEIGLPDEMAWELFGPFAARALGNREAVANRTPAAVAALDQALAERWVILNRAPTFWPANELACRPRRHADRVIRFHPVLTPLLNADFDGDQAAVFVPVTAAGQEEARQKLSLVGHLRRDPSLVTWLFPEQDALWGLAELSRKPAGRQEITALAGHEVAAPEGFLTRATVTDALREVLAASGPEAMLAALDRLFRRGLEVAQAAGASLSPFAGETLERLDCPAPDDQAGWQRVVEEYSNRLAAACAFDDPDLGPQFLSVRTRARGNVRQLMVLAATGGLVMDAGGQLVPNAGCFVAGLSPAEVFSRTAGARHGLVESVRQCDRFTRQAFGLAEPRRSESFTALARAERATHPGSVLLLAAMGGETDPLTDLDTRLFVGLRP